MCLLQAFRAADRRKAGAINFKALRDILDTMQKKPLTNEQFYMITADADLENSGLLEFKEYIMVCCQTPSYSQHKTAKT
jgi:Ca2+-binding EF-hand superfamily protein